MAKQELDQTKFNSALKYLERIHNILSGLDEVTVEREVETDSGRLMTVFKINYGHLFSLYKELKAKMDDGEKKRHEEAAKEVKKQFNRVKVAYEKNMAVTLGFLEFFDTWELELRDFAQSKGLIMPDKNSTLDALGLN